MRSPRPSGGWLLVAVGAVVVVAVGAMTNIFTGALPPHWTWAHDWRLTGVAFAVVALLAVLVAVIQHRRGRLDATHSSSEPTVVVQHASNVYAGPAPTMEDPVLTGPGTDARPVRFGRIPSEPPRWQARATLLDRLRELPARQGRATRLALVGMRGVGKTQLAAAFARECAEQGWGVIWLSLETAGQLPERFAELAWILGIRAPNAQVKAEAVRSWLETYPSQLLLVLDNALDMNELDHWLPSTGGATVVITTTSRAASNVANAIEVEPFSPGQAKDYLRSQTGLEDQAGLDELVEELGCLPLALAQAAWVIRMQGRSFAEYLVLLRSMEVNRLLAEVPGAAYPRGVAQAVLLSVQECEQGTKRGWAERILDISSVLSPTGISREVVSRAATFLAFKPPRDDYGSALGKLVDASLLTLSNDQRYFAMHRLVQRVIRDRLRRRRRLGTVLSPVGEALMWGTPLRNFRLVGGEEGLALADQCIYLWRSFCEETGRPGFGVFHRPVRPLMRRRFVELRGLAAIQLLAIDFPRGEQLAHTVLRDFEGAFRRKQRVIFSWRARISEVMAEVGRSDAAVPIAETTLTNAEKVFGQQHEIYADAQADLGKRYSVVHRYGEAIGLLESAIASRERTHGPDGWKVQSFRVELGSAYRAAGRFDEAVELQKRAVQALAAIVDDFEGLHSALYHAQRELGITYRESRRPKQAVAILKQTMRRCRQTEGSDSLIGLMCRCELAMTFHGEYSPARAVTLLEGSLPRLEVLGPDRLIRYQGYLATAYLRSGRPSDAAALISRTTTSLEKVLGDKHGAVRAMREHLAGIRL